ncbi:AGAP012607-PA-like protein [Anopheles sinensis]|uniref:AGAP012607-PA-like protein n=1 Tax=Anopheles sinensis TaxID=74873 RepID=A0A084WBF8_ANOSI|nr:AGAP012607-PA-like protein [Anopheles sinensis]
MSLYSGILFGVALGAGAWLNSLQEPIPIVQLAILAALIMVMLYRYWSTRAFMPAGMIILLSFGVVVWTCVIYRDYLAVGWMRGAPYSDHNFTVVIVDENSKLE